MPPPKRDNLTSAERIAQSPAAQKAIQALHAHGVAPAKDNAKPTHVERLGEQNTDGGDQGYKDRIKELAAQKPDTIKPEQFAKDVRPDGPRTNKSNIKQIVKDGPQSLDPSKFSQQQQSQDSQNAKASIIAQHGATPPAANESKTQEAAQALKNEGVKAKDPKQEVGSLSPTKTPNQNTDEYSGRERGRTLAGDNESAQSKKDIVKQYAPPPPQQGQERTKGMEPGR